MRKPDELVKEVVCSETGKQKHPALPSLADIEPIRRGAAEKDVVKSPTALLEDADTEYEEEEEEVADDDED